METGKGSHGAETQRNENRVDAPQEEHEHAEKSTNGTSDAARRNETLTMSNA